LPELIGENGGRKEPLILTQTRSTGNVGHGIPWFAYPEIAKALELWHKIGERDSEPSRADFDTIRKCLSDYQAREHQAKFRTDQLTRLGMAWMLGDGWRCPADVEAAGSGLYDIWEKAGRFTLTPKQIAYLDSAVRRYVQKFGSESLKVPNDGKVVPERKKGTPNFGSYWR
jgi:hypothetical protein